MHCKHVNLIACSLVTTGNLNFDRLCNVCKLWDIVLTTFESVCTLHQELSLIKL